MLMSLFIEKKKKKKNIKVPICTLSFFVPPLKFFFFYVLESMYPFTLKGYLWSRNKCLGIFSFVFVSKSEATMYPSYIINNCSNHAQDLCLRVPCHGALVSKLILQAMASEVSSNITLYPTLMVLCQSKIFVSVHLN